jgi:hypothetical protein
MLVVERHRTVRRLQPTDVDRSPSDDATIDRGCIMPSTTIDLRGHWHRILGGDCANAYPAHLEFQETRYAGTKDESTQGFIIWDVGTYRVETESVMMIQTATDEQHHYRYRLDGNRLTFVDDAGCAFAYERDESVRFSAPR